MSASGAQADKGRAAVPPPSRMRECERIGTPMRGSGGAICCRDVAQPVMGAPLANPASWLPP